MMTFNIDHAWIPKKWQTFFPFLRNQVGNIEASRLYNFLTILPFVGKLTCIVLKEVGAEDVAHLLECTSNVSGSGFDLQHHIN